MSNHSFNATLLSVLQKLKVIFFSQRNSTSKTFTISIARVQIQLMLSNDCLSHCLSNYTLIKFSGPKTKHPCL